MANQNHASGTWLPDPIKEECGFETAAGYITGGQDSYRGQFPFMAALGYLRPIVFGVEAPEFVFNCAGSLINRRYVITAAHCHYTNVDQLRISKVVLGEHDFSVRRMKDFKIQEFDIEPDDVILHEDWLSDETISRGDDIALVRLPRLVNTVIEDPTGGGQFVLPICLPWKSALPDTSESDVRIAGWGRTNNDGRDYGDTLNSGFYEPVLQWVSVPEYPFEKCRDSFYHFYISKDKHICAGPDRG